MSGFAGKGGKAKGSGGGKGSKSKGASNEAQGGKVKTQRVNLSFKNLIRRPAHQRLARL